MSDQMFSRLRFLIKKKRANLITDKECTELMKILAEVRKDEHYASGIKVAAGIVLATMVGKEKPKELMA